MPLVCAESTVAMTGGAARCRNGLRPGGAASRRHAGYTGERRGAHRENYGGWLRILAHGATRWPPWLREGKDQHTCAEGRSGPFTCASRHVRSSACFAISESHQHYRHPARPGRVAIAGHPDDDLVPGTLNSVVKQAQLAKPEKGGRWERIAFRSLRNIIFRRCARYVAE